MQRILLIHWNEKEACNRAAQLEAAGYEVQHDPKPSPLMLRRLRNAPPAAVVLDLTRLPSHGMDIGLAIRHAASTRHVPLVYAEGDPEKVERIQKLLPDAVYTKWSRIRSALKRAIASPPAHPFVPESALAGYSGAPLPKKLGIKPGSVVALLDAPEDFRSTLGELPKGAVLCERADGKHSLMLWFLARRRDLKKRIGHMVRLAGDYPLWIIWPKKASGMGSDLTQQIVRESGLAAGLVDYKICAVDSTWSGLLFRRRK